jgi:DNA-binding MarR family transcriptional regulator
MTLSDRQYLQINQALLSVAHTYETRLMSEEQERPTGLAPSERTVLMVLGQFKRITSRQLAQRMDLTPATISVHVQGLVEKGLVERAQDRHDRRNWWLTLSRAGQTAYREAIAGTITYTRDSLSALDESQQRMLHQLLLKTSHSLGFDWR